ncbi:hypothetical protein T265_04738 [Opisthorchis viverrini]|uniref:Reverse transcriptase domain-containing protein n=1 Tax=Opisthorchis viverrini TaxID=6198 RepID=A0A074ZRG6_OPIVI|nr:hypothetical protein T265_04738 [Opisthorchis viverrini]KER28427.1 hypothetical protein T265_04738 [Opisthorchis viverrini]
MRRTLGCLQSTGVRIVASEDRVDLEYADDIAFIFEDQAQSLLNRLTTIIPSFGMRLAPSMCKVLLPNAQYLSISFTIKGGIIGDSGKFYLPRSTGYIA